MVRTQGISQLLTCALRRSLQGKVHKLQWVDLIGELNDKDLVELKALRSAPRVIEELKQGVGELMP